MLHTLELLPRLWGQKVPASCCYSQVPIRRSHQLIMSCAHRHLPPCLQSNVTVTVAYKHIPSKWLCARLLHRPACLGMLLSAKSCHSDK